MKVTFQPQRLLNPHTLLPQVCTCILLFVFFQGKQYKQAKITKFHIYQNDGLHFSFLLHLLLLLLLFTFLLIFPNDEYVALNPWLSEYDISDVLSELCIRGRCFNATDV